MGNIFLVTSHTESGETVKDVIIRDAKEEVDINLKAYDLEVKESFKDLPLNTKKHRQIL